MLFSSEFHKDFSSFRISTNEISLNGLTLTKIISKEALTALLLEPKNHLFSFKALASTEACFKLERENDYSFKINTKANMGLYCACVRCLETVNFSFLLDFKIRMLDSKHFAKDGENFLQFENSDLDMSKDENTVGYFADKCIDLGVILRDQIFLQVPDYPQCGSKDGAFVNNCGKDLPLMSEQETILENPFVKLLKKK